MIGSHRLWRERTLAFLEKTGIDRAFCCGLSASAPFYCSHS